MSVKDLFNSSSESLENSESESNGNKKREILKLKRNITNKNN